MANRALLVGINKYPGSPLQGCVNDVTDMRELLRSKYGFASKDILLLTDAKATRANINDGLNWLMQAATTGNRLLFHYSGHGTQMPTGPHTIEDAICPVDFDFTKQHALTASDFVGIFGAIPQGVEFNWVSDSCYSGNLTKALLPAGSRPRHLPPPNELMNQMESIARSGQARVLRFHTSSPLNGGFISGCAADETSADAVFRVANGYRSNGAFTYYLLEELNRQAESSLTNLAQSIISDLRAGGYSQTPQVRGATGVTSQAFLGGTAADHVQHHAERILSSLMVPSGNGPRRHPARSIKHANLDLSGAWIKVDFGKELVVLDEYDLQRMFERLAPVMAEQVVRAKRGGKRDWSVTGAVSTTAGGATVSASGTASGRDWSASLSGSTAIGSGLTGTAGISAGSGGTSGLVGISGHF